MSRSHFRTAFAMGVRQYVRNGVLIALLVTVPIAFVWLTFRVSPRMQVPVRTFYHGFTVSRPYHMPHVHGVVVTQITVAFLAGMGGLFVVRSTAAQDRRLAIAGASPTGLVAARFAMVGALSVVVTGLATAVAFLEYVPRHPAAFLVATLLVALLYGCIGMLVATALDRLSGLYVLLFGPMMDLGVFQNPMFLRGAPPWWTKAYPGFHPMQVIWDVSFTETFDTAPFLAVTVGYAVVVALAAAVRYRRVVSG